MRGFGASDKPREKTAYENSAMARDVVALIDHLRLDAVDVIGFSMGAGTAARLLLLRPPQVKSAILAGFGDYAMEDTVMEFPKSWPVPDSVPRPITLLTHLRCRQVIPPQFQFWNWRNVSFTWPTSRATEQSASPSLRL
jgi:pimeloyl-ACP methyl ester carboxylesterase